MKKLGLFIVIGWVILYLPKYSMGQDNGITDEKISRPNTVSVNLEHDFVEGDQQDWNLGYLSYQRETPMVTYIGRLRYANRFGIASTLAETDIYPEFSSENYAHINTGASLTDNELFPKFKLGVTYYDNLFGSVTGGLGVRYQHFDISDVVIYTTELHIYIKDFLLMGQSYFEVPDKRLLGTVVLTARKYLDIPENFLEVKVAGGQSPEGLRFQNDVINTFSGYLIYLGMQRQFLDKWNLRSSIKFNHSNFSSNQTRNRIGIQLGASYQF